MCIYMYINIYVFLYINVYVCKIHIVCLLILSNTIRGKYHFTEEDTKTQEGDLPVVP